MYVVNCLDSVMGGLLSLEEAWTSFKNRRYDHCAMYICHHIYWSSTQGTFTIGFNDYDLRPCHETTIEIFHKLNTKQV